MAVSYFITLFLVIAVVCFFLRAIYLLPSEAKKANRYSLLKIRLEIAKEADKEKREQLMKDIEEAVSQEYSQIPKQ
jgi:hypothetical protein